MSSLKYWLWLSGAEGLSPKARAAVIRAYSEPEQAFFAPDGELGRLEGISEKEAEILEKRDLSRAGEIEGACAEQGISIITMAESRYPSGLKNIFAPPPVIYVKGRVKSLDGLPALAVIGTRRASPYGLKMGRDIAWQICRCGGAVISLLGSGIDSQAARGALLAGGRCIGVLGLPHEMASGALYEDVAASGALVSEYPPGTRAQKSFFRERNRIASGLSLGVVVVEAPERSGTRLFVMEAAEQGREIFAVPGNADAASCAGSNALIKEGARLVTTGAEVMSEFEALYPDIIRLSDKKPPEEKAPESGNKSTAGAESSENKKKDLDKQKSKGYICLREQLSSLSAEQLKIITAIDKNTVHIDDIIEATGLPAGKVLSQLTVLEIKGYVKREPGRRIRLNTAKK